MFKYIVALLLVSVFLIPSGTATNAQSSYEFAVSENLFDHAQKKEVDYFEQMTPVINDLEKSIECMALNIYHEARNESLSGQEAVAWVVLNRVNSDLFPDSVCKVIYQARYSTWWKKEHGKDVPLRNKCQFSWYCDGKSDKVYEPDKYEIARDVAFSIIMGYNKLVDITNGALWYHADYVDPYWSDDYEQTVKIDTHIFYTKRT